MSIWGEIIDPLAYRLGSEISIIITPNCYANVFSGSFCWQ